MSQKVAVVGLGYVGLPLAILAAKKGYDVSGIEYDQTKVDAIIASLSPYWDPEVTAQLKKIKIKATTDYSGVKNANIVIVCVPTPVDKGKMPDLEPVIGACTSIARNLGKNQLVIIESTINPGVCEEVVIPLIEKESGKKCGKDFLLAHCPERINPGDPKYNVSNIARVVGGYDKNSLDKAHEFYCRIIDAPIKKMASLKEAEAVKVVENSFRDINIAFVNELAMSFDILGIDVVNVIDGAATKPFAFMPHFPGAGVGGHCIPVDPYYLIEYAKTNGFEHLFLQTARKINENMPAYTVSLAQKELKKLNKELSGAKVTVLGLSYKPNVGDLRESPSIEIIRHLEEKGANVAVYDPYVEGYAGLPNGFGKSGDKANTENAISGADLVIVATAHKVFSELKGSDFSKAGVKVVIDGRNCLDGKSIKESKILYRGIGRS